MNSREDKSEKITNEISFNEMKNIYNAILDDDSTVLKAILHR